MIRIHYVACYNAVISCYNEESTKRHIRIEDTSAKTEMSFYTKIFFFIHILGSYLHYKTLSEHWPQLSGSTLKAWLTHRDNIGGFITQPHILMRNFPISAPQPLTSWLTDTPVYASPRQVNGLYGWSETAKAEEPGNAAVPYVSTWRCSGLLCNCI